MTIISGAGQAVDLFGLSKAARQALTPEQSGAVDGVKQAMHQANFMTVVADFHNQIKQTPFLLNQVTSMAGRQFVKTANALPSPDLQQAIAGLHILKNALENEHVQQLRTTPGDLPQMLNLAARLTETAIPLYEKVLGNKINAQTKNLEQLPQESQAQGRAIPSLSLFGD